MKKTKRDQIAGASQMAWAILKVFQKKNIQKRRKGV